MRCELLRRGVTHNAAGKLSSSPSHLRIRDGPEGQSTAKPDGMRGEIFPSRKGGPIERYPRPLLTKGDGKMSREKCFELES
jgi:hypothetical protein